MTYAPHDHSSQIISGFDSSCKNCIAKRREKYARSVYQRNRQRYGISLPRRERRFAMVWLTEQEQEEEEALANLTDVTVYTSLYLVNHNSTIELCKSKEKCTICCDILYESITRKLKCKHTYHVYCIDDWLETHKTCPNCRHELKTH